MTTKQAIDTINYMLARNPYNPRQHEALTMAILSLKKEGEGEGGEVG